MSVLVEAISVLVTSSTLAAKYPGGVEQYELDAPNDTYCSDGHLTRVGFMAPLDVKAFVNKLRELGLAFHDGRQFVDIAVVDQHQGPTSLCPWLECGRHPKWFALAWLRGMSPSPMAAPAIGQLISPRNCISFRRKTLIQAYCHCYATAWSIPS